VTASVGGGLSHRVELASGEHITLWSWAIGPDPRWYGRLFLTTSRLIWIGHRFPLGWLRQPVVIALGDIVDVSTDGRERQLFVRDRTSHRWLFVPGSRLRLVLALNALFWSVDTSEDIRTWMDALQHGRADPG